MLDPVRPRPEVKREHLSGLRVAAWNTVGLAWNYGTVGRTMNTSGEIKTTPGEGTPPDSAPSHSHGGQGQQGDVGEQALTGTTFQGDDGQPTNFQGDEGQTQLLRKAWEKP